MSRTQHHPRPGSVRRVLLATVAVLSGIATAPAYAGTVVSWGGDSHLELGACFKSKGGSLEPTVTPVTGATEVAAGNAGEWGAALLETGQVETWGGNQQGQAGNGTVSNLQVCPSLVPGLSGVVKLAVGGDHAIGLLSSGRVVTWGSNSKGQDGNGTQGVKGKANNVLGPYTVPGVTTGVGVAAGGANDYVLLADGTVLGWGEDVHGQLGDSSKLNKTRPVPVKGLSGVVEISAAGYAIVGAHLLARLADGTVAGIGTDGNGQLGNGTATSVITHVVKAAGLTGVERVSAGVDHTLAVAHGVLYGWGNDASGQLGAPASGVCSHGTEHHACALRPQPIPLAGVSAFAAGVQFSLVAADGQLYSFGANTTGTLGDGSRTASMAPVHVGVAGVMSLAGSETDGYAVSTEPPLPVIRTTTGKGSVTVEWRSAVSEPWHVAIKPADAKSFGPAVKLPGTARSYLFTVLPGVYEISVQSPRFGQRIVKGTSE